MRASPTGACVTFLQQHTHGPLPCLSTQTPNNSQQPAVATGLPTPSASLGDNRFPPRATLSTVRAVRKIRGFLRKAVVFRKRDSSGSQNRCWFFLSMTKTHRVRDAMACLPRRLEIRRTCSKCSGVLKGSNWNALPKPGSAKETAWQPAAPGSSPGHRNGFPGCRLTVV